MKSGNQTERTEQSQVFGAVISLTCTEGRNEERSTRIEPAAFSEYGKLVDSGLRNGDVIAYDGGQSSRRCAVSKKYDDCLK